ncbi:hypothetical protein [Proteus terrae]|uniref:hypothetical protein n=1 Tax=Proteus terrae TaxID=1574161 RepID=UPI00288C157C|nr:hypothetical protein [Proteus terrae]
MGTEAYNLTSVILYGISAVIAFFMLGIAIYQLSNLTAQIKEAVKANKISGLSAFLEIESQLNNNRIELARASVNAAELTDDSLESEKSAVSLYLNQCIEMYLNSLDRLCFCIIKEYFDNDEMKIEYRNVINDAVKAHPERFQQASNHRNIMKIHNKWADS